MKLAERCQNLRKKCDLLKNEASLAKRETNKYTEHVRNVDERERVVHMQVVRLDIFSYLPSNSSLPRDLVMHRPPWSARCG